MNRESVEKIYAGLLGMDAGMRLGAPVESPYWSYDRLVEYFGNMTDYLRVFKHYAADDDVNGPVIFLRALTDNGVKNGFTAEMAGETWLNYTRCGKGMFWWGGEDMSTEHRAYMNLKRGVKAPASGSMELNGQVAAEQIGGQIFIDTWGLIWPGNPAKAAEYAVKAASASHDGEGLYGAAFMAAAVAAAFDCETVDQVLDAALEQIPADSHYHRIVEAVRAFHKENPDDFRACRDYIDREWGVDKYPGYCHIVNNAGICVLSMLYGGGDLGRTIEIACMCAFDTDCNASNTGTILGVLGGLAGIPKRYREPINDLGVLSSSCGYLNYLDHAAFAKELVAIACELRDEPMPEWLQQAKPGELLFDFELPGSTHGLSGSDKCAHELRSVRGKAHSGEGCLELLIDGKMPEPYDLSFYGFFTRADFNDERYDPVFAPRVYPGQTVECWMKSEQIAKAEITVTPYITKAFDDERIAFPATVLPEGEWTKLSFTVPYLNGDQVHQLGWRIEIMPEVKPWTYGKVYIDDVTVTGPMVYTIDPAVQRIEFGQVTPFSLNDGEGMLENGKIRFVTVDDGVAQGGQAFTGNYYMRDTVIETGVTPIRGGCGLVLRSQGCRRFYTLGLLSEGKAAITRHDAGAVTLLAETAFDWKTGETYILKAEAHGDVLTLSVNNEKVLETADERFAYGMAGFAHPAAGESIWNGFHIAASV